MQHFVYFQKKIHGMELVLYKFFVVIKQTNSPVITERQPSLHIGILNHGQVLLFFG